uniref:Uncharacterized protein n=1 Tax=Lepeophtheirus salmonis TaxID=72036 RepID=A0A0K2T8L1_LEPSM
MERTKQRTIIYCYNKKKGISTLLSLWTSRSLENLESRWKV